MATLRACGAFGGVTVRLNGLVIPHEVADFLVGSEIFRDVSQPLHKATARQATPLDMTKR
jgi:hypothetical protein